MQFKQPAKQGLLRWWARWLAVALLVALLLALCAQQLGQGTTRQADVPEGALA
jgi:type II secretory pathway component PulL